MSSKSQIERTYDGIRIVPTEDFSKRSFSINEEETQLRKNNGKETKSIPLSGLKRRTLVFKAKDEEQQIRSYKLSGCDHYAGSTQATSERA